MIITWSENSCCVVPGPWCRLLLTSVRRHCLSLMSAPSTVHSPSVTEWCAAYQLTCPVTHLATEEDDILDQGFSFLFPFFVRSPALKSLQHAGSSVYISLGLILEICKMWYIVSWDNLFRKLKYQWEEIPVLPIVNQYISGAKNIKQQYQCWQDCWIFVETEISTEE